jgi:multicomponent Na+:H+ antiporter subunit D
VEYEPYTVEHLVSQFQLLLFAGLAFFVLLPLMKRTETLSLEFDWLYRRVGKVAAGGLADGMSRWWGALGVATRDRYGRLSTAMSRTHGMEGPLAKSWPVGSMVFWVAVLLGAFLAFELLPF